ncbi:MAG: trypsin-like peptidase domain-containing protein [Bryobacteraceae bacterium]|nr:trypsin-like peptidase domain-containing protein [Bryobacteraceae bacterium]
MVLAQSRADLRLVDQSLADLSEKVSPAVVQILSDAYSPLSPDPGAPAAYEQTFGSGIILSSDGYIVTNAHLVKGSTRVSVVLPGSVSRAARGSIVRPRGRTLPARLIGLDRETDLAVLKVEARDLAHLTLGDSDRVRQGQLVLAFGSPFGLQNSMSMGIVSAVARQLEDDDPMIYIQSDVSINPGNSGGPMVDVEGKVIGLNTMIISESGGSEGVGLAVPANIVKSVTDQIIRSGVARRGEIGIFPQTITSGMVPALGLPEDAGVVLGDVTPDGPADRAGLAPGDVILTLNGKPMENARQLQVNLYSQALDSVVDVEVMRDGRRLSRRVTVAERPNDPDRFAALVNREVATISRLGILGLEIGTQVRELLPTTRKPRGILVANVLAAAGRQAGVIETGDIIYTVNRKAVGTLEELKAALQNLPASETVILQVERDGRLRFVEVVLD